MNRRSDGETFSSERERNLGIEWKREEKDLGREWEKEREKKSWERVEEKERWRLRDGARGMLKVAVSIFH